MRPEHQLLASELEDIFRRSLQEYSSASESSALWKTSDANGKALRFLELNSQAAAAFLEKRSQVAVINNPTLVHMLWLLDIEAARVREYVDLLLQSAIGRSFPHTKFWSAYSRAIATFSGIAIAANPDPKPNLAGYEKYWEPYLDYMAGSISADNFATLAASSFAARNRQSKCVDWQSLDGDGKTQVRWDFRYSAIERKVSQAIDRA